MSETQQSAARWRAWTYQSLEWQQSLRADKVEENAASWAEKFLTRIMATTITPLVDMFKSEPKFELKPQVIAEIKQLAVDAYLWRHKVNTGFFHHDFHPFLFKFDEKFDPQTMAREARTKMKPERIIASVGLGLKSSAAKGQNQKPQEVLQLKVSVVATKDI